MSSGNFSFFPSSAGAGSNASVGANGATAPTSATLVGAIDTMSGVLDPLASLKESTFNNLLVAIGATNYIPSPNNSTVAQLTAGSTFTGTIESTLNQESVLVSLTSDQNGTLTIKQYIDLAGTFQLPAIVISVTGGVAQNISRYVAGNYFNITFQNTGGVSTTTLNISTFKGTMPSIDNTGAQLISGAVTIAANSSVNVAQINGITPLMGNGVTGTGSQRVTIASDNTPFAVKVDQTTPGTTNAVSLAQIGSTTVASGNGVSGAGVQRVAIASDNTAFNVTSNSANISTEATLAKLPVAQGSTTSGQSGPLIQGAVTTAAPTYSTTQTAPLSLTTAGLLRVDSSGTTAGVNVAQINGVVPLMGNGVTGTGSLRVTLASDTTSNTNPLLFNQSQINGVALAAGNGVSGTGVQRVAIASDNTAFSVNANLQAGTNLVGKVGIDQTTPGTTNGVQVNAALPAGTNLMGKVGIDQTTVGTTNAVSLAQIGANTVLTGNGVAGTGAQRVTIASDNTAFSVNATLQAGSNLAGKFGIDQTTIGTTNGVSLVPSSTSTSGLSRAATSAYATNLVVKASAGRLYQITGYNSLNTSQFLQVHNSTTLPADTAVPIETFIVSGQSNFSFDLPAGLGDVYSTGIVICNSTTGPTKTIGAANCWIVAKYL